MSIMGGNTLRSTETHLLLINVAFAPRQFRYITSTMMHATMAAITNRQPNLVMQLMIVNGSRMSFIAKLSGQNNNFNSANTI